MKCLMLGAVSSVVERFAYTEEVVGSSPTPLILLTAACGREGRKEGKARKVFYNPLRSP